MIKNKNRLNVKMTLHLADGKGVVENDRDFV